MKINYQNILYWVLFLFLSTIMIIALFGLLGVYEVCPTDEATHGVNAYEMIQNGNLWINTLRYQVDYYNTKPPLMLWLIILGYRLFGYTPLGMRFFSAVAGLLIYLLTFFFVYKIRGKLQAIIFSAFLPACTWLFNFHMFRSGDMDSVYTLIFLIAVIALYEAQNKLSYLYLYGIALGLAFMCKGTHVITILGVGLLFAPFLYHKWGVAKTVLCYFISYTASILVICPWAIVRFRFDGTVFFSNLIFGETLGRVQGSISSTERSYFGYIIQLLREPICLVSMLLIFIAIIIYTFRSLRINNEKKSPKISLESSYFYLIAAWFIVVIGIYSITKSGLEWYIYSAYIPLILMGSEALSYLIRKINLYSQYIGIAMLAVLLAFSTLISINSIQKYPWKGDGGSPRIGFYHTLLRARDFTDELFSTRTAYIENNYNISFAPNYWEHDYMFYAVTTLDVICKDGGVSAFLETDDMEAILFLSKDLWDEYAPVLTGYVILEDSGYLVFSKDRYG